jgi:hypothetical protein
VPLPAAPLAGYVEALQEAEQILEAGATAGDDAASDAAALSRARSLLAPFTRITMPNGAEITLSPLLGETGDGLTAAAAAARIRTLLAELRAAENDATAARLAVLREVFAGSAFQSGDSWWDAFLRWLAEWIARILPAPAPASGTAQPPTALGDFVAWLLGGLGALALLLLLVYWLRGLIRSFVPDAAAAGEAGSDLPQTPAAARRLAAGAADAGDYRGAVRNLYLAALLTLEQHGLVPADRSLTNRELLAKADRTGDLRPHLEPVVAVFDDVWYGVHEPDANTYTAYTQAIDRLEALAASKPAGSGPGQGAPVAGGVEGVP